MRSRLGIGMWFFQVAFAMTVPSKKGGSPVSKRIGVLISGRGSNLQAIIDAVAARQLDAEIAIVISNRPNALGIDRAREAGVDVVVLDHLDTTQFPTRDDYDSE